VESAKVVQETKRGARRQEPSTTTIVVVVCMDVSYFIGKWGRTKRMLETGGTGGNEE